MTERAKYRSVFVSDAHLGFRGARPRALLSFLKSIDCEYLYLVGDIPDIWELKRSGEWWSDDCGAVVRRILKMAQKGTKVVYLPGNHDEAVRRAIPIEFAGITVVDEAIHETATGDRYAVIHGDRYDVVVGRMRWLALLGSTAYDLLLLLNGWLHAVRVRLGYSSYWSLAGYLKQKAKEAVSFIDDFEAALADHAIANGCDGVICGHIHRAKVGTVNGVKYVNCGDWVESLTAAVEDDNGWLRIVKWHSLEAHDEFGYSIE